MKHINVALFVVHKGCPHTCTFCNQRSISGFQRELTPADVDEAVKTALDSMSEEQVGEGEIAFFGGSFTMIEREYMISLLQCAFRYVEKGLFRGIRISTRPDGINTEICEILKKHGVSAVELGAQSLSDRVLEMNERGHTAADVENAMKLLKSHGFETGLQMMTGLYGSDDRDSIETAEKIISMKPDTVRIYPTVVIEGTKLCDYMNEGIFTPVGVEDTVKLCARLIPMFNEAGIKIIRVGLHSGGDVQEHYAGGAFHPALRELCESRIYYEKAMDMLSGKPAGKYVLGVNPAEVSKMTGQKKGNLDLLAKEGYICRVQKNENVPKLSIQVEKEV